MKFKSSRVLFFSMFLCGVLVLGVIGATLYHNWEKGNFTKSKVSTIYEADLILKKIENSNGIKKVQKYVKKDSASKSIDELKKLTDQIKILEAVFKSKTKDSLNQSIYDIKYVLNKLIELPEFTVVNNVILRKIVSFENFVRSNNWKTLTRISNQIIEESKSKFNYAKVGYTTKKISSYFRFLKTNFKKMEIITSRSVLSREDKNTIISRLRNFEKEVQMIERYYAGLMEFDKKFTALDFAFDSWQSEISPSVSLRKSEFETDIQNIAVILAGVTFFVFLTLLISWLALQKDEKRNEARLEETILDTVKMSLISKDKKEAYQGSDYFQKQIGKYHDYVQKRMSFGTIFKEALPFPAIMLDSNLHLNWGNEIFFNEWKISNKLSEQEEINWDYIQRFTNLGEDDPVLQAVSQKIAGIYQIQVKIDDNQTIPYEMYVSPVEIDNKLKVMIFFYSLSNLEQSIQHQVKSIVGPVKRTLNAMISEEANGEFLSNVKKDFLIAGIQEIYDKFLSCNDKYNNRFEFFMTQIDRLESRLCDTVKIASDMNHIISQSNLRQKKLINAIHELKESYIAQVEKREARVKFVQSMHKQYKDIYKESYNYDEKASVARSVLGENVECINKLVDLRHKLKNSKEKVEDYRKRVSQSIDQSYILKRSSSSSFSDFEQVLSKIKMEVKNFDTASRELSSIITSLDVGISKSELVMNANDKVDLTFEHDFYNHSLEVFESAIFEFEKIGQQIENRDSDIVSSMTDIFKNVKMEINENQSLKSLYEAIDVEDSFPNEATAKKAEERNVLEV